MENCEERLKILWGPERRKRLIGELEGWPPFSAYPDDIRELVAQTLCEVVRTFSKLPKEFQKKYRKHLKKADAANFWGYAVEMAVCLFLKERGFTPERPPERKGQASLDFVIRVGQRELMIEVTVLNPPEGKDYVRTEKKGSRLSHEMIESERGDAYRAWVQEKVREKVEQILGSGIGQAPVLIFFVSVVRTSLGADLHDFAFNNALLGTLGATILIREETGSKKGQIVVSEPYHSGKVSYFQENVNRRLAGIVHSRIRPPSLSLQTVRYFRDSKSTHGEPPDLRVSLADLFKQDEIMDLNYIKSPIFLDLSSDG